MTENNKRYTLYLKNITYVIFAILTLFLALSCATTATNTSEIALDEIPFASNDEVSVSFESEQLSYAVIDEKDTLATTTIEKTAPTAVVREESNRETMDNEIVEEAPIFIGKREEAVLPQEKKTETVRFVYLDEDGNEIRQSVKKIPSSELLESQFESSIESISSKRDFYNSIVEYNYKDGKVYDIIVNATSVTDIRLEGGESVSGNIALGETENWTIETTMSVENGSETLHFLVRSEEESGETVLIVPTNRRTYYLRLIATKGRSMIGVRFKYKSSDLLSSKGPNSSATYPISSKNSNMYDVDVRNLSFAYRIESNSDIAPTSVFSNESSTFFQFDPRFVYQKSAPSLYLKRGNKLELINYTIRGNLYFTATVIGENESFVFLEGENTTEVFKEE